MSKTVKVLEFDNEFEANQLDGILAEKNIPHIIRTYHDSAYDGLWQSQSGWGHLEAPENFSEEILAIFKDMSANP